MVTIGDILGVKTCEGFSLFWSHCFSALYCFEVLCCLVPSLVYLLVSFTGFYIEDKPTIVISKGIANFLDFYILVKNFYPLSVFQFSLPQKVFTRKNLQK